MSESLLVALRSYRPRAGRDSLEDFLTEAFVWTLKEHPGLARALLKYISAEAGVDGAVGQEAIRWQTQVHLDSGVADAAAETSARTYLFEHKTWSKATARQLDRYRRAMPADDVVTVLITGAPWNYEGPQEEGVEEPDLRLTWAEVYNVLEAWCEAAAGGYERVEDLLALLDHEGLGPRDPLSEDRLRAYARAAGVERDLFRLVESIPERFEDWSFAYDVLLDTEGRTRPEKEWNRMGSPPNGRICLSLYSEWEPGLMAGLLVDGTDLHVGLDCPELGPDVIVMLCLPRRALGDRYEQVLRSDAYVALCERLEEVEGWKVAARPYYEAVGTNPWHPVLLQRSLAKVLRGVPSDDQERAVYQTMREGIELVLEGREFNALRVLVQVMDAQAD